MAVRVKAPSTGEGPSSKLLLVAITPCFRVPATTVPTPGTPKVSSMMNSTGLAAFSDLQRTVAERQANVVAEKDSRHHALYSLVPQK